MGLKSYKVIPEALQHLQVVVGGADESAVLQVSCHCAASQEWQRREWSAHWHLRCQPLTGLVEYLMGYAQVQPDLEASAHGDSAMVLSQGPEGEAYCVLGMVEERQP